MDAPATTTAQQISDPLAAIAAESIQSFALAGDDFTVTPFTILVDSREKAPYHFTGLLTDKSARGGQRPIVVAHKYQHLPTGDYSIEGCESEIAIERKSLEDLYSTLGSNRERFEREHERLAAMKRAAVVIEADWPTILCQPPNGSRLNPKTIHRTMLSWFGKYGVPWLAMGNRRLAEITTYRFLEKYWERKSHVDSGS
jgi:ERCC4-type nuclease